jgi:GT2 family glycosyltransferase
MRGKLGCFPGATSPSLAEGRITVRRTTRWGSHPRKLRAVQRLNESLPHTKARAAPGVPEAVALWRVGAVIPCFSRPADLRLLLKDLAGQEPQDGRAQLRVLVVDNASDPPLESGDAPPPPGLDIEFLRLQTNRGGSGGFNAGLWAWLQRGVPGDACELLWLLDSDARLEPGALAALLDALGSDSSLGAVGSALADTETGEVFELGGRVDPATGELVQELPQGWQSATVLHTEYIAACSMLVRRSIVERAGLMADVFLNGDDVEWSYRLARVTGCGVGVAPASRVRHPRPDRMRTVARYYAARNAFRAIDEASRPRPDRPGWDPAPARAERAMRETARALAMVMVGREDLAELHLRGLEDAAGGRDIGPAPEGRITFDRGAPLSELPEALRSLLSGGRRGRVFIRRGALPDQAPVLRTLNALCSEPIIRGDEQGNYASFAAAALRRLFVGPDYALAVVSGRGRPQDWLLGRTLVTVADGAFTVRRINRIATARRLISVELRGRAAARRLRSRARTGTDTPAPVRAGPRPTVSVVILSYNRWDKLRATLEHLRGDLALAGAQIIVADNASSDGTPERVLQQFPTVELLALPENRGVAAFNEAVRRTTGEAVLILDDDAWPAVGAVEAALDVLARRADIGAVALHPRHPGTQQSEWPFASVVQQPEERWPVMGCGNLVRREAWERVGGYEEAFFLYRNDTDLALKLLAAAYGVYFDPALMVWHDSPAASRKSLRWFELATRNWIWVCRRHGRGVHRALGIVSGWVWAHRLAGGSFRSHLSVVRGAIAGCVRAAPPMPEGVRGRHHLRDLLRVRFGR